MDEIDTIKLYKHFAIGLIEELENTGVTKLYANLEENPYVYIRNRDGKPALGVRPLGQMIRATIALHSGDSIGWHLQQLRKLAARCMRSIKGLKQEEEVAARSNGHASAPSSWAIRPLEALLEKTTKEISDVENGLIRIECEKADKEKGPGDESPSPSIEKVGQDPT